MSSWALRSPYFTGGRTRRALREARAGLQECARVLSRCTQRVWHLRRERLVKAIDGTTDDVAHRIRHNDTGRGFPEPIAVNQQINILRARLGQLGVNTDENLLHRSLLLH